MATTLPERFHHLTVRPPHMGDVEAIAHNVRACEIAEEEEASTVPEEIIELWENEHINLDKDAQLLTTADGTIIGYVGIVKGNDGVMLDPHTHIHPRYHDQELERYLLRFAEERARLMVESDPSLPRFITTPSFSPTRTALLQQEGYTLVESELRMEIHLHEAPPAPATIEGIVIRPYLAGQEERTVHAVIQEAFRDIGGRTPRTFEEWEESNLHRTSFDPALLYVALEGTNIVGTIICRAYPEQQQGYITQVAVRRQWRRRGIALQLLRAVFGACYQRGMPQVQLSVHTHNTTGAQELYQRAGMHQIAQIDDMRKAL